MKLIPRRRERASTMSIVEHLEELRGRLGVALIAVAVGAVVGWFLFPWVMDYLRGPFCDAVKALPESQRPPTGCSLLFTGPVEPFMVKLKIVFFIGLAVALPVMLWEFWAFVTPGLTQRERRLAVPFVLSSLLLFLLGGWFAMLTLPRGLNFLLGFAGEGFVTFLTASRYISFVMLLIAAFGLAFEFPLVLIFLGWAGVLSSRQLRDFRRYAILGIAIFAAVITPSQDPYTMLMLMAPMVLFYEVAILVIRGMKK